MPGAASPAGSTATTIAAPSRGRLRDLVGLVTADLGGPDHLSEAQRQIVRRIASLSVGCEIEEARMADGDEIDIDEFQRCSNSLRRLCESVGLERVARDVTPDLATYTRIKAEKAEVEAC